jgi:hypothetical protein
MACALYLFTPGVHKFAQTLGATSKLCTPNAWHLFTSWRSTNIDATVQIFVARRADKQDFCTSYLGFSVWGKDGCKVANDAFAKYLHSVLDCPHPLLVPWSRKGRAISLLHLWAVRPVQCLSVCTRVHFTFTGMYLSSATTVTSKTFVNAGCS